MDSNNMWETSLMRWACWFFNILGHYMLFAPILALIKWIPLMGWFLHHIASWAAMLFSMTWGSMLHLLVMGVAWSYYRPVYGTIFLLLFTTLLIWTFTIDPGADPAASKNVAAAA